jgi:uncharacterized membrane protein
MATMALTPPARSAFAAAAAKATTTAAVEKKWEHLVLRIGFFAAGAFVFGTTFAVWVLGQLNAHHEVVWLLFVQYGLAFALLTAGVLPARRLDRVTFLIPVGVVFAMLLWMYVKIEIAQPIYGTDNLAFTHVAAERLLDGQNPYSISDPAVTAEAADRFGLPRTFITSTTDGEPLKSIMSWPGGSVLIFVPALWLGLGDLRWVVVGFETAVLLLLWSAAPRQLRPLMAIPLAGEPNLFLEFTGGGVVDFIWVLPLMMAALALYRRRFGWSALLWGLSCGIKQQPWLLGPFLLVYAWKSQSDLTQRQRVVNAMTLGTVAAGGFLALNLPFMIWDFHGWFAGTMLPFRAPLVPLGSGVSLVTQTGIVQLPQSFYTLATIGVTAVLTLAYWMHFRTLRHTLWLAPALIMFFGYRGLQNYFIFWVPLMLIGLIAWWQEEQRVSD